MTTPAESAEARERYLMEKVRALTSDLDAARALLREACWLVENIPATFASAEWVRRRNVFLAPSADSPVFSAPVPLDPPFPTLSREDARIARDRINPPPRDPDADSPAPPTLEHCADEHCYHKGVLHSHQREADSPVPAEPARTGPLGCSWFESSTGTYCVLARGHDGIHDIPDNGPRDADLAETDVRKQLQLASRMLGKLEHQTTEHRIMLGADGDRIDKLTATVAALDAKLELATMAMEEHRHCRHCGTSLSLANLVVADGCPCNSGRGINHGLVPRDVCTCAECDPAKTGGSRRRGTCLAHLPSDEGGWNDATASNYRRTYGTLPPCTCPAAPPAPVAASVVTDHAFASYRRNDGSWGEACRFFRPEPDRFCGRYAADHAPVAEPVPVKPPCDVCGRPTGGCCTKLAPPETAGPGQQGGEPCLKQGSADDESIGADRPPSSSTVPAPLLATGQRQAEREASRARQLTQNIDLPDRESQTFLCGHGIRELRAAWSRKGRRRLVITYWDRKGDRWKPLGHPVALDEAGRARLMAMIHAALQPATANDPIHKETR